MCFGACLACLDVDYLASLLTPVDDASLFLPIIVQCGIAVACVETPWLGVRYCSMLCRVPPTAP